MFEKIISVIMAVTSLISVCVSAWAIRQSRRAQLTGSYFSEMTAVYKNFIFAVNDFMYNHCDLRKRDALSAALLQLQLYAPPVIDQAAQQMYCLLLDWGENPQNDALHIDKKLQRIQADMRADLDFFRREGHH